MCLQGNRSYGRGGVRVSVDAEGVLSHMRGLLFRFRLSFSRPSDVFNVVYPTEGCLVGGLLHSGQRGAGGGQGAYDRLFVSVYVPPAGTDRAAKVATKIFECVLSLLSKCRA